MSGASLLAPLPLLAEAVAKTAYGASVAELVEVVGVYAVPGAPDAHLVEVRAPTPPEELDVGAFTQEVPDEPRENWQAPWMERWLDASGEELLTEEFDPPPEGLSESRLVFFLHLLSFDRPLLTPAGPVQLPSPADLPERLSAVRYEPVD